MKTSHPSLFVFALLCIFAIFPLASPSMAANTLADRTEQLAEDVEEMEERFEENRLVNRESADVLAWVFMGALVGALAGTFSRLGTTLAGRLMRLVLGLAGAFLGGMVVRVGNIDFGWPIIEIPLVEALFSLLGAIFLVVLIRGGSAYLKRRSKRTLAKPSVRKSDS